MPQFDAVDEPFRLMISLDSEDDRDKLMQIIGNSIVIKRIGKMWTIKWPEKGRQDLSSVRFE
jgi:hypothetical protein